MQDTANAEELCEYTTNMVVRQSPNVMTNDSFKYTMPSFGSECIDNYSLSSKPDKNLDIIKEYKNIECKQSGGI